MPPGVLDGLEAAVSPWRVIEHGRVRRLLTVAVVAVASLSCWVRRGGRAVRVWSAPDSSTTAAGQRGSRTWRSAATHEGEEEIVTTLPKPNPVTPGRHAESDERTEEAVMHDPGPPVPVRRGRPSVEVLGTFSLVCTGLFLAIVALLHLIDRANPVDHQISEYALGPSGWLMTVAFLVVGAGIFALCVGLHRSLIPGPRVWAAWLIAVTGVSFIGLAGFPTDPQLADGTTVNSFSGQMHALFSSVGPVFLIVGAFVLRRVLARDQRWHPLARVTGWFGVAMTLWFVAGVAVAAVFGPGNGNGAVQRLFWLVLLGWLALMGARLRRLGAAPTAAPVAPAIIRAATR